MVDEMRSFSVFYMFYLENCHHICINIYYFVSIFYYPITIRIFDKTGLNTSLTRIQFLNQHKIQGNKTYHV